MSKKNIIFNPAIKRSKAVRFLVTEEELAILNSLKTNPELATWARGTLLSLSSTERHLDQKTIRVIAGIGNNLNQLSKDINTAANDDKVKTLDVVRIRLQLVQLEEVLAELRHLLLKE